MSPRDKHIVRRRKEALEHERFELGRGTYGEFSPEELEARQADLTSRIRILKSWLVGTPRTQEEKDKPMTREEFDASVQEVLGDKGPKKSIIIDSNKMLDEIWDWIKHLDIEVRAPQSVKAYFIQKLKNERTYAK